MKRNTEGCAGPSEAKDKARTRHPRTVMPKADAPPLVTGGQSAVFPFPGLRPKQRDVFEQIAVGNDTGHSPAALAVLVKRGLIVRLADRVVGRDVFGLISIPQYEVPLPIHYAWCQWCGETVPDSTNSAITPEKSDDA